MTDQVLEIITILFLIQIAELIIAIILAWIFIQVSKLFSGEKRVKQNQKEVNHVNKNARVRERRL